MKSKPPETEGRPLLLTVSEAAQMLSISITTLLKLQRAGELMPVYLGDGRSGKRYTYEAIEAFVRARAAQAQPRQGRGRPRTGDHA